MQIDHTSMTKIVEKGYDFTIEYEQTVPTEQYGNMKPKLTATVPIEDVSGTLNIMRKVLQLEKHKIKNDKQGESYEN